MTCVCKRDIRLIYMNKQIEGQKLDKNETSRIQWKICARGGMLL